MTLLPCVIDNFPFPLIVPFFFISFDSKPGPEGFAANVALKRPLASMNAPVQDKKVFSYEPFAAVLTFIGVFVLVSQAMVLQKVASSKRFATDVALVRLLASVNA